MGIQEIVEYLLQMQTPANQKIEISYSNELQKLIILLYTEPITLLELWVYLFGLFHVNEKILSKSSKIYSECRMKSKFKFVV